MSIFDSRLEIRLNSERKNLIERAAHFLGIKPSDYVRATLERDAKRVLEDAQRIRLTQRDWERFLEVLNEEATPNTTLQRAAAEFEADIKAGKIQI